MNQTPETFSPQQLTEIGDKARAARKAKTTGWGWTLGDAALRLAPWDTPRAEAMQLVSPLASEVDISPATLDTYRRVAYSWTPAERDVPNVSFAVFQILYKCKDLIRAGMHTPEATRLAQELRHIVRTERAAEAVARLARDHPTIVQPVEDTAGTRGEPDLASRITGLIRDTERQHSPVPPPPPSPPQAPKSLTDRVLDVAWRIEQAMVEDGPEQEVAILADAIVDVLADMDQVAKVAEQLRARVRWASTRKEGRPLS